MSTEVELVKTEPKAVTAVRAGAIGVVKLGFEDACHFAVGNRRLAERMEELAKEHNRSLRKGEPNIHIRALRPGPIRELGIYWFYGHPVDPVLGFLRSLAVE